MALICWPYFGNGMADLMPGLRFGVSFSFIQREFRAKRSMSIKFLFITLDLLEI